MRFNLSSWRALLVEFRKFGLEICGVDSFLRRMRNRIDEKNFVILRHDVDRFAWRALRMAEIESEIGVSSTYYFRSLPRGGFKSLEIRKISDFGHEVGYHYEALSRQSGSRQRAMLQFERDLTDLRTLSVCRTVAMHGAPLSRYNNQDLLDGIDLGIYGLSGDAVTHMLSYDPIYLTDTGGEWGASTDKNMRDRLGSNLRSVVPPESEREFANWAAGLDRPLYINTHPERWASSSAGEWQVRILDNATNLAKRIVAAASARRL
jgi:hypothetical protein